MAGHRRGPGRIPEKPKNFKGTIGQLFRYLGRYRLGLALVLVLALASTAFGIVGPKFSRRPRRSWPPASGASSRASAASTSARSAGSC